MKTNEKISFINSYFVKNENRKLYLYNGILFTEFILSGMAQTEATTKKDITYILDTFVNYVRSKESK